MVSRFLGGVVSRVKLVVIVVIALAALCTPALLAEAAGPGPQNGLQKTHTLSKGPVKLAMSTSHPLHQPVNPPKLVTISKTTRSAVPSTAAATCATPAIDLKVLVLATD